MKVKRKTKIWKFKTKKEAADFFLIALTMEYSKGGKIVEAIQPNKIRVTLLPVVAEKSGDK